MTQKQHQDGGSGGLRLKRLGITGLWTFLIFAFLLNIGSLCAQTDDEVRETLEEAGEEGLLMFYDPGEIMVTSSARRPQPLKRATSAMYIITAEDIRQSGASDLADILRTVPGMDAAVKRGDQLALGLRGFAITASRRMMVLLDGRPLYEPWGGGLDFKYLPVFKENIERIEVIRGAAGVIWGVNAVNGVVNIITKKPADTQGGFGYGGFGNRHLQDGYLRYGGTDGPFTWRGTTGAHHDNGLGTNSGRGSNDYTQNFMATGRGDYQLKDGSILSFSGGSSGNSVGNGTTEQVRRYNYQHMNLSWEKALSEDSTIAVRWFETWYDRQIIAKEHRITREDMLQVEHSFVTGNHSFVTGADYIRDTMHVKPIDSTFTDRANPDSFSNDQGSIFIQDEITLRDDLWLTLGYRLHHNEISHGDWAGIVALVHEVAPKHFLRAAVSRSFRRPTLREEFAHEQKGSKVVQGNEGLWNETLISYELGYRGMIRDNLELNVEGFVNKHKDLIGQVGSKNVNTYFNTYGVTTYGLETAIDWRPRDWWLIRGFHVYEHQTDETELSSYTDGYMTTYSVPKHKVGLTNRFYLDDKTTLNTQLYWYDAYYNPTGADHVKPFYRFDVRLAKKIWNDNAEIAVGATNLTKHLHPEGAAGGQEIPRMIYFQFFYKF